MKLKTLLASAFVLAANAASAQAVIDPKPKVPEIDALAGVAAIALVGAAVALIRERSK